MDPEKPCGDARYNQLIVQEERSAVEQREFDSLDLACNRYVDSLAAQKSTGEKVLDVTPMILLAVVVALVWLGHTLGNVRFG